MTAHDTKRSARIFIRMCGYAFAGVCLLVLFSAGTAHAQGFPRRHALLISGLGGTPEYRDTFHSFLFETRKVLVDKYRFSEEDIIALADTRNPDEDFIDDISSAENIRAACAALLEKVKDTDDVYIVLFGHGSFDGKNAMLNIPQQDLKDSEYAALVESINARRIVFVNTTSCSGPFIDFLSGPNHIVITATRTGTERNETVFPRFFIEALKTDVADRDKNGDLSVLEIFQYASEKTARFYQDDNHLETEHPLLEDTGDKRAFTAGELANTTEGSLSRMTYLFEKAELAAAAPGVPDSVVVKLVEEQRKINQEIAVVISEKAKYQELAYYAKLEPLFIYLATINDELETYRNR